MKGRSKRGAHLRIGMRFLMAPLPELRIAMQNSHPLNADRELGESRAVIAQAM